VPDDLIARIRTAPTLDDVLDAVELTVEKDILANNNLHRLREQALPRWVTLTPEERSILNGALYLDKDKLFSLLEVLDNGEE
jgi:hypothetical protein